jgi:CheY-like chemotaxis protein
MSGLVQIVDDDESTRELLGLVLENNGFDAMTARDGVDALEQLRARRPALILLDMRMPRMNGLELMDRFRTDPALRAIPVVVFSGDSGTEQPALDLGARAFMRKPLDLDELLATVGRLAQV